MVAALPREKICFIFCLGLTGMMSSYLGQIGCQGDGVSRQGTQVIYDSVGGSEI